MLLGTKKTLYDHIVERLLEKEASVSNIEADLMGKNIQASIQGIYKALRELITEDIVVKQKKVYSISNIWREKVSNLTSNKYQFKLSPDEQAVYQFNKLEHLDAFWKHTLADIRNEVGDFPTFDYIPHQFWAHVPGRQESESEYYKTFEKGNIYLFTTVGGATLFDKEEKVAQQTELNQIANAENDTFERQDNNTVMNSYVVTTKISKKLSSHIDSAYELAKDREELDMLLKQAFRTPGKLKITMEHNKNKATKLRKKFSADFYIPKELREKFDLF